MNVGDKVRVIGIPADLKDDDQLHTADLFQKCLGKTFVIAAIVRPEGLSKDLVQLDVGHVIGRQSYAETIWIEEDLLERDPQLTD